MDLDEFIQKLANRNSKTIGNLNISKKVRDGFNPVREFFYHEYYVKEILFSISEVKSLLEQLNISIIQISNYRNTKKNSLNKITRFDWYIYNIENYYFRFTGILDRILNVVIKVLTIKLGDKESIIPARFLKTQNGDKGQHAHKIFGKNQKLFDELVKFQEFINLKRDLRDKITHIERYEDFSLRDIEMIDIVLKNEVDAPRSLRYLYKSKFDAKVSCKKIELQNDLHKIKSHIDTIIGILEKDFDKEYKAIIQKHYQLSTKEQKEMLSNYQLNGLTEEEIKVVEGE